MDYSEKNRIDFPEQMFALNVDFCEKDGDFWSMASPQAGPLSSSDDSHQDNPYAIGAKRSFVPVLGDIIWELPADAKVPFYAYICQVSDGQKVGYVRVPHYNRYDKKAVKEFTKLIARFESSTSAMVLDQINNAGGSMFYMYAILSTLTNRVLILPKHQLSLYPELVTKASEIVAKADSGEALPPSSVAFYRFVLSEIEAGREELTNPVHLGGVVEILPAQNHYTKKIVVLINELTFSAPEFLAAILQDNRRATLFGVRTAGAGGCVRTIKFPNNPFGVDSMTITWTMAWRTDGQPIEDIGVHPDVRYSVTAEDIRSGYLGYRQALLATIKD